MSPTSPCCASALTCGSGTSAGLVNDHYSIAGLALQYAPGTHYSATLRIFPQFDQVSIYRDELYSMVLSALGSIYSVVFTVFAAILMAYRRMDKSKRVRGDHKLAMSPAPAVQATTHV